MKKYKFILTFARDDDYVSELQTFTKISRYNLEPDPMAKVRREEN
jgi:hypothetical protein